MTSTLCLFVAVADIRSPVSTRVHCSDATPEMGGTVGARISQEGAEMLYDACESRGSYVRLDWSALEREDVPPTRTKLPPHSECLVDGIEWEVETSFHFGKSRHVNLQHDLCGICSKISTRGNILPQTPHKSCWK